MNVRFLLIIFLAASLSFPGLAAESAKPLRILTVGNSFAYNATKFLPELAASTGRQVQIASANFRGCSLELHWKTAQAAEAGRQEGAIYPPATPGGTKRSLRDFLSVGPWDIITIQQASPLSNDPSSYRPFGPNLAAYIRRYAPDAEIVVHQTWAYRSDDPRFKDGSTPAAMHEAIRRAYHSLADELGARLVPVGDAFAIAGADPQWTYRPDPDFDPRAVRYPDVPPQPHSLHVGWRWFVKPTGTKFALDARHANLFGQYLGSCVFFEFLFAQSVVGNPFVPPGITAGQARSLQEAAHQAVAGVHTKPAS